MRSGEINLKCFDVNDVMNEGYMHRRVVNISLAAQGWLQVSTAFVSIC
jgi:hypothetical protein